jgi:hypothetical protein
MHDLYDHAHKVLPKNMKPGEIYKGDALFGGDRQPESRDGHISFMPNLLRYKYPKGSNDADRIQRAKVGVAFHTHYDAKGRASPITDEQRNKFQSHPDVYDMDPRVKVDPQNYTPAERTDYNTHMENARREYQKLDPGAYDAMGHHNMDMRGYANDVVRKGTGEPLTTENYIGHLNSKHEKEIAKYLDKISLFYEREKTFKKCKHKKLLNILHNHMLHRLKEKQNIEMKMKKRIIMMLKTLCMIQEYQEEILMQLKH